MKILITGYTTRMFNSPRIAYDYVTFSTILRNLLIEMGHQVDHKKVDVYDNIRNEYHFAFCGVAPLNSITSGKVPETHHVMTSMPDRHAVFADDWSFCDFGKSVEYTLTRWDKYLAYKNFGYGANILENTRQSLERMLTNPRHLNSTIVAPMFKWGNHKFLLNNNYEAPLVAVDPSAWVEFPDVKVPPPSQKKKYWIMAALSDHTRWIKKQGFKLPVQYVGNKRMVGCPVLPEDKVVQLFADSFGVLSTGYPSAGSGWWRTRYLNATWAESIMYCDPIDQKTMGAAYQLTPATVENITSEAEYLAVVNEQKEWLDLNLETKEEVKDKLEKIIRKWI